MANYKDKIEAAFNKVNQRIDEFKVAIIETVANEATDSILDNFKNESFNGVKWQQRKNNARAGKNILIKSGNLRRSTQLAYGFRSNGFIIGSDLPYAAVHNNGGTINRKARTAIVAHKSFSKGIRKGKVLFSKNNEKATYSQKVNISAYSYQMPQRQFIGNTPELRARLLKAGKEKYLEIMSRR